ncbi:MAG: methionine--tRNA ligase [Myxococcota bacterium]
MAKKVFITSALPYANGSIHLGHLVEYIQTDIYARYRRLKGDDVVYVCADDTHGTPIEINALKQGIKPEELVERYHREHSEDFERFEINFDIFYTTNSEENRYYSELFFKRLKENGYIYQKEIELHYCEYDKRFLPDRYIKGKCPKCGAPDQYGDVCEKCNSTYNTSEVIDPYCVICGNKPIIKPAKHYFFKLSSFRDELRRFIENSNFLQEEIRNYVLRWINEGLKDWCISRNGPYFGFKIPDEEDLYFYVWLDAPIGYISSLQKYCNDNNRKIDEFLKDRDAEIIHFIGKDIVYFHALFWPAMLMGAGFKMPDILSVHGMLTINGEKMSKSRGTFITARQYLRHLEPFYLRYYFASNLLKKPDDIDLSFNDFVTRVNAELVSNISNFTYRTLSFISKRFGGELSTLPNEGVPTEDVLRLVKETDNYFMEREFRKAVQTINQICFIGNKFVSDMKPWELIEKDAKLCQQYLTWCANLCKILAILLKPIVPSLSLSLENQLNLKGLKFSDLTFNLQNHKLGEIKMLATRLELKDVNKIIEPLEEKANQQKKDEGLSPELIDYDYFAKLDLRVAEILEAERIKNSKKLLRLIIDCGEKRQIVAGIGEYYTPEELIGRKIMVICNLKPVKLMGVESNGMLLAGSLPDSKIYLATFDREAINGSKVK